MNVKFFSKFYSKYKSTIVYALFIGLLLNSCSEEPLLWSLKSTEMVASDYIKSKPEYSEFAKLVEITGLEPLLGIRGPYTIMLPNNDAMFAYYKEKGVNSLEEFNEIFRNTLIRNHLITNEINTSDIGLGALRDTNAIGDFLVTEFQGSDIILNKYSKIINRDIRLANGYAHVIERVIDPVTKDIFTAISEDPSYKIFTEGLRISGINDTLNVISFPYGNRTARVRFTLLAVPDTIYQRYGINNVDDLIKWTGANPDSLTYLNNPFYRYMEYHCLAGTHYLSDLNTTLYPILSHDNNVSITVDTDYKINLFPKTQKYTAFIVPSSNTPSKNGAIHAINGLLPVIQPEPQEILFETTDFFDLKQGDYYQKYYNMWYDGKNSLANIHWEGEFLQYFYQSKAGMMNHDCIRMTGFWTLSVTFPKVMKGKYDIILGQQLLGQLSDFRVYLDGAVTPYIYEGSQGGEQKIASGNFLTTTEHTITIESLEYGFIFWDYVKFVPVE